jgi:hypothetical protein
MTEKDDQPLGRNYQIDPVLIAVILEAEARETDGSVPAEEKGIHIILTVGGLLVTGQLIGRSSWANAQADTSEESSKDGATAETPSPPSDERKYIHLKDARFYSGGRTVPSEGDGFYWRGRVAAVDGFALGSLTMVSRKSEPRTIDINGVRITVD